MGLGGTKVNDSRIEKPPLLATLPASLVLRLAQAGRFNTAMTAARSLDVDMSDLFGHLTTRCIRLSRAPDSVM